MAVIYMLILLKMLVYLNFRKDTDFYKGFHCTVMVLSSYSKWFSIKYLPQVGTGSITSPAEMAMVINFLGEDIFAE